MPTKYLSLNSFNSFYFFHVLGANNINIGNNSNLPANISKINTILETSENCEKFPAGPVIPRPGPILFNVAATEVKFVIKSNSSNVIKNKDKTKIRI